MTISMGSRWPTENRAIKIWVSAFISLTPIMPRSSVKVRSVVTGLRSECT